MNNIIPTILDSHAVACVLQNVRQRSVKVHCLTNPVAQNVTANIILAAGGTPSMTSAAREMNAFVDSVDVVAMNLGMWEEHREAAINVASARCVETAKRWILDPVKVERSEQRCAYAARLLEQGASVLRCNLPEAMALKHYLGLDRWQALFLSGKSVLCITGAQDRIYCGGTVYTIDNGSLLMDRVTAMGCALSGYMGVFLAAEENLAQAVVAAVGCYNVAGEIAAEQVNGPGSFSGAFIDQLYSLTLDDVMARLKVASHSLTDLPLP
ncbi:hydroxyethylthiazole kinase [Polycladidibacter stylochi]|uniref:hydroxyethylthiazole kinase n=1 Tax=Polycladidibacter stylochi TaxID=1807766 RepID=UPI0008305F2E|nr:hydroxyethylthiazole kinase [Pseudovibrio stylochi]